MAVDFEYAYNYWRKTFSNLSEYWDKNDFDEWFLNGAEPVVASIGYLGTVDNPGSPEHRYEILKQSFITMLQACARGDFE